MDNGLELNLQPDAGILGVFSRLSYKPYYAIAEFVDNSTASYYDHINSLKFYKFNKLRIDINYDSEENILTISDDAFGMEIDDFKRAIKLDSPPPVNNGIGRNEFGMGLKTAASWFGNFWSVESTQLNSKNKYYAEVDIEHLRLEKINVVAIDVSTVDPLEHGTKITIKKITKKINAPKTIKKIKDILQSMYRRDISERNNNIEIYFNGLKLNYVQLEPLTFRDTIWKKEVNFVTYFDGKDYPVTGFVGILKDGGYKKAGFALFRRDRVVVGGADNNYLPLEIFVQSQSTIAHKLYGELNLDSFPVNQAKDGFAWDDGLEEEFLKDLKLNISDYIKVAKLTNKERLAETEFSLENSEKINNNVQLKLDNYNEYSNDQKNEDGEYYNETEREFLEELKCETIENKQLIQLTRNYTLPFIRDSKKISVIWAIDDSGYWFDYDEQSNKVIININFDFFKPYVKDEKFKEIIETFVLAFILAEDATRFSGINGSISQNAFSYQMNKALVKLCRK